MLRQDRAWGRRTSPGLCFGSHTPRSSLDVLWRASERGKERWSMPSVGGLCPACKRPIGVHLPSARYPRSAVPVGWVDVVNGRCRVQGQPAAQRCWYAHARSQRAKRQRPRCWSGWWRPPGSIGLVEPRGVERLKSVGWWWRPSHALDTPPAPTGPTGQIETLLVSPPPPRRQRPRAESPRSACRPSAGRRPACPQRPDCGWPAWRLQSKCGEASRCA